MTVLNSHGVVNHSNSQIEGPTELSQGPNPIPLAHSNGPTPEVSDGDEKGGLNVHDTTEGTRDSRNYWKRILDIISWVPPRCRWDPENPSKFGLPLNILFAFSGTFTVCHMIVERCKELVADILHRSPIYITRIQFLIFSHGILASRMNESR
jgi:hypothetical protein